MYTFPHESRIWIYQASRDLADNDIKTIGEFLEPFCESWTAHDQALKAGFKVLYKRFIVLIVDETRAGASGCSIDKSVKALRELSAKSGIDFFDRMQMAYLEHDEVKTIPYELITKSFRNSEISSNTLFFNLNLSTLGELENKFLIPLNLHWLNKAVLQEDKNP